MTQCGEGAGSEGSSTAQLSGLVVLFSPCVCCLLIKNPRSSTRCKGQGRELGQLTCGAENWQVGSRVEGVGPGAPSPRKETQWGEGGLYKLLRSKFRKEPTGWHWVFPPSFLFFPLCNSPFPLRMTRIGKLSWVCPEHWVKEPRRQVHLARLTSRSPERREGGSQTSLLDLYFNFRKELRKHALESQEGDKS